MERFHRTLKELLRLSTIPENQTEFEHELELIIDWYNEHRPHETLASRKRQRSEETQRGGERLSELAPAANGQPPFDAAHTMATRFTLRGASGGLEGDPGDPIIFEIDCLDGRRHLPLIRVRRAA